MSADDAIKGIRRAAKARERASAAHKTATAELRDYCEQARAADVPISRIAQEAGLSRQGVYDLLAERPAR